MRDAFVQPYGQDDNLGDSALRAGLLAALGAAGVRLHVYLEGQTSDYVSGLRLAAGSGSRLYADRGEWVHAAASAPRPIYVVNAGEINPQVDQSYPYADQRAEMRNFVRSGGKVIAVGLGLKNVVAGASIRFDHLLQEASCVSWRDFGSREAAGFGEVAPDWAFALGSRPSTWLSRDARPYLTVTLRFDRPWPVDAWFAQVRTFAEHTGTSIVTVAQVARDAPRAVRLAEALGGKYLVPPSTRHDDLDDHVRAIYARSLAVVSDRAHALIMGATEGAYPVGTSSDAQKIERILAAAGLGSLTGHHDTFAARVDGLDSELGGLARAIDDARGKLSALTARIAAALAD